ncbi:MAG: ATP-binding cassette domain-containing protein [Alphaproteobacteria bacterium]|nr:ATP-binding cassette domain-containing protein [Alphaproteobacteria bacterium]
MEETKTRKSPDKPLRFLWPMLRPYKLQLAGGLLAMAVSSGTTLAIGWGLKVIVDKAFASHDATVLNHALLGLLAVVLLMAGASYTRLQLVWKVAERVTADLRKKIYEHLLTLDPAFFEEYKTGDQVSRINADTTVLQLVITNNLPTAVRHSLMLTGGIILLCVVSPSMTLMVLGVVALVILPIMFFGRKVRAKSRESQDRVGDISAYGLETLQGVQTIQSFGYEEEAVAHFGGLADESYKAAMRYVGIRSFLVAFIIAMVFTAIGSLLWVGGHRVLTGEMTAGALSAFIFYAAILSGSVTALGEAMSDFSRAGGAADRITALLERTSSLKSAAAPRLAEKDVTAVRTAADVVFEDVSFSYPSRPNQLALDGVSFAVSAGEVAALVGPSGAGKSTVFQLLQRFFDPASGDIRIAGQDILSMNPRDVRGYLSVVAQDPAIFSMSVADNIRIGKPEATEEEVRHAAEQAQAHEFIMDMPEKYDTLVGERGSRLSGGQRQRIAIARAILKDAKILLLDEATSALDASNEVAVHKALKNLMEGRTTLIIAHRLSTVQNADKIIVLDNGHVMSVGSHKELYGQDSLYTHLAGLQMDLKAGNG